ncbi:MAG: hypothetical protein JXN61_02615, partial [Sedimentisphaerales bacterium]|nr:hypothetical protein [Sedimentisphaerales bacterium]
LNAEGAWDFPIRPGEQASMIKAITGQFFQVGYIVEIEIDDRAVMFARCDQHSRLFTKLKIAWVVGMEAQQSSRRTCVPNGGTLHHSNK